MSSSLRLTPQTAAVLEVLLESPTQPLYGLEIARAAGLKTGTMHPILARLERAGLVEKFWEEPAEDVRRPRRRYYRFTTTGVTDARQLLAEARAGAPTASRHLQPGY